MTRELGRELVTIIDETPTDAELVARVRAGDNEAYGELWSRHVDVARGLARRITSRDPEDLIGESYTRILTAIQAGRGPDTAFRPYLMSTIRRVNIDNARRYHTRIVPTDSPELLDPHSSESSEDVAMRRAEGSSAIAAWQSLPAETRDLLWDLVVMDETPARLSGKLGMSPNAVASRARRARERLRQAYLTQLVSSDANDECQLIRADLGAYVRGNLGVTRRETVEQHLETCAQCRGAIADLRSVDDMIRLRVVPLLPVVALGAAHELGGAGALTMATKKALAVAKPALARVPALNGPAGFVAAASGLAAAVAISAVVLTSGHDRPASTARPQAPATSSTSNADRARAVGTAAAPVAAPVAAPAAATVALVSAMPRHVTIGARRPAPARATHVVPQWDSGPSTPAAPITPTAVPPSPTTSPAPTVPPPPQSSPPPPSNPLPTDPEPPASDQDEQGDQDGEKDPTAPPTPAAASGPITVVLAPGATSTTLTKLRLPQGWMITSVSTLSDHPSNRSSHLPARSFVGFVEPGQVTVVVTRTSASEPGGSLAYEFVDRGGKLDRGQRSLS